MAVLHFDPTKLPRTMTKAEWKAAWRWKRKCERELLRALERDYQMLREGKVPEWAKKDMLDKIIYPPIILGTPL